MRAEVVWLRSARQELEEIAAYIAVDSEAAAKRLVQRLNRKAGLLSDFPRLGPRRSDIGLSMRMLLEGPYLLLYRTVPDDDDAEVVEVEIVSVVDGRRDLGRLF